MKKLYISLFVIFCLFVTTSVYATNDSRILNETTAGQLIQIKEKEMKEMSDYTETYGSETYGFTAYMLNKIRVYSIPLCFIGIAVGAIWQYVIGIRKLDVHDRGLMLIVTFVTIFVICQVLPLIFAIVVKGFRN
ncbi:MAG: hypothetical protein HFJ53_00370 [Clostridia bacterium]|jgi:hypothetical protein|nr:hypothetical protein [Clostridia bacterium]